MRRKKYEPVFPEYFSGVHLPFSSTGCKKGTGQLIRQQDLERFLTELQQLVGVQLPQLQPREKINLKSLQAGEDRWI